MVISHMPKLHLGLVLCLDVNAPCLRWYITEDEPRFSRIALPPALMSTRHHTYAYDRKSSIEVDTNAPFYFRFQMAND